jgi:hypothetical protein
MAATLAIRTDHRNADHHLWLNNGTWWCHFTVHLTGNRARRLRHSLRTRDQSQARRRRDRIFQQLVHGIEGGVR